MSDRMHIRLFLASGHLSPEACKAYMDGILRQDVAALAEAHLSKCDFCREGLAGLQKADARGDLQENLLDLQLRIRQSAREREVARPAFRISRQTLRWAAVSAAAILIIGLIFSFLLLDLEPLRLRMALAGEYTTIPEDRSQMMPHLPQPVIPASDSSSIDPVYFPAEIALSEPVTINQDQETANEMASKDDAIALSVAEDTDAKNLTAPSPAMDAKKDDAFAKDAVTLSDVAGTQQELEEVTIISESRTLSKRQKQSNEVFTVVEKMPSYPGGMPALQAYLVQALQLPPETDPVNVVVQFIVDDRGKVRDAEVLKGMNPDIDKAVLRAIRRMPDWTPGYQRDVAVKTRMVLPVKITPSND
ncbi:MAG TPA: energy transducer TonB [Bacteroidales bacterium]|nr:energy transducer TonB [Bacteroidales bacterium]